MRDLSSGWSDEEKKYMDYKGSYEPFVRDIDPTIFLKETKANWSIEIDSKLWWNSKVNFQWEKENKEWLNSINDIPNPKKSIYFTDDEGIEWVALSSTPNWIEPIKKGVEKSQIIHKEAWYILNAFLIQKNNIAEFKTWAKNQTYLSSKMPKPNDNYQIYNREFYWSDTYDFFQNPYYGHSEWSQLDSDVGEKEYSNKIGLTTAKYYWESEYDYSKNDSLNMKKPSNILFQGMGMKYSKKEGYFIDESGELICFDPSIYHDSTSYLMVRKDKLLAFLERENLTLCWILEGEKQVITPNFTSDENVGVMQMKGYVFLDGEGIINIRDAEQLPEMYNKSIKIEEMV